MADPGVLIGANHTHPGLEALTKRYPYEIVQYREGAFMRTVFEIRFTHPKSAVKFKNELRIDDEHARRFNDYEKFIGLVLEQLERACQDLTVGMGEEFTGKYPFARLWADRHLTKNKVPFFCNPGKDIPGWVWPLVKQKSTYPEDGTVIAKSATREFDSADITDDGNDAITERARKTARMLGRTSKANIHGAHPEMILEGIEMAKTDTKEKRKVKVVKKAIDPNTIKKPNCKIHNTAMEFDPVTQKWRCTVEGCNLVARPKGDDTDREVRVGKGNIQCRLISNEGELTVVLISDDNVTLDITRFVDIRKLIDEFDAVNIADAASTNGRETFSINDPKQLPIKMSLTVMGATDLVVNSDKD